MHAAARAVSASSTTKTAKPLIHLRLRLPRIHIHRALFDARGPKTPRRGSPPTPRPVLVNRALAAAPPHSCHHTPMHTRQTPRPPCSCSDMYKTDTTALLALLAPAHTKPPPRNGALAYALLLMPGNGRLLRRWLVVCVRPARREARLVVWGGGTRTRGVEPGRAVGEVMAEHAGHVVCRADGFRVGRPAPVLGVGDRLEAGRTYVVVPVDRLPCGGTDGVVTAASLAALSRSHSRHGGRAAAPSLALAAGRKSPFEYAKDRDGRTVIRVAEEFIVRAVAGDGGGDGKSDKRRGGADGDCGSASAALCSTPELRKHYEQLVGAARGRPWSPRLDTIKERKGRRLADVVSLSPGRLSPVRLLGMDKRLSIS